MMFLEECLSNGALDDFFHLQKTCNNSDNTPNRIYPSVFMAADKANIIIATVHSYVKEGTTPLQLQIRVLKSLQEHWDRRRHWKVVVMGDWVSRVVALISTGR